MTTTTISLSTDRFDIGAWLSSLLLPSDEAQTSPTAESVIATVANWNSGDIADAIGSVIGAVCIDRYGDADTRATSLFTENRVIRRVIGLRRRSRLYVQRNLGKRAMALRALEEAVRIAEEVLARRAFFLAQIDRYHEDIEDDLSYLRKVDDEELENAESADIHYVGLTSLCVDRRLKARQNEIGLDKLNGTFRTSRSGKRNSGVNRRDKVRSRARNAFYRSVSTRRAYDYS